MFRKHEFTPTAWATLKKQIEVTTTNPDGESVTTWDASKVIAVHEIGHICTKWGEDAEGMPVCEVESPMYAVDILWVSDMPSDFASAVVWPNPCGVHIFAGWAEAYAKDFCEANPEAEFCKVPDSIDPLTDGQS